MALSLITGPATEPITLTEAKLHLRVEHATDDALITDIIKAARETAENYTERSFITQTWDLKADSFPSIIRLPRPPTISITTVKYVDSAGTLTLLTVTTDYQTDIPTGPHAERARIYPAYSTSWPTIRDGTLNAIEIRFVAGYGAAAAVPLQLKQAMYLLIGAMYENREAVSVIQRGDTAAEIPLGARWLLDAFAVGEFA